jgi:hypothetical protein
MPAPGRPQEQKIHHLLYSIGTQPVLGDAHAVAGDHRLALHIRPRDAFQLRARQPAARKDLIPGGFSQIGSECLKALGVFRDERPVEDRRLAGIPRCIVRLEH